MRGRERERERERERGRERWVSKGVNERSSGNGLLRSCCSSGIREKDTGRCTKRQRQINKDRDRAIDRDIDIRRHTIRLTNYSALKLFM